MQTDDQWTESPQDKGPTTYYLWGDQGSKARDQWTEISRSGMKDLLSVQCGVGK